MSEEKIELSGIILKDKIIRFGVATQNGTLSIIICAELQKERTIILIGGKK